MSERKTIRDAELSLRKTLQKQGMRGWEQRRKWAKSITAEAVKSLKTNG